MRKGKTRGRPKRVSAKVARRRRERKAADLARFARAFASLGGKARAKVLGAKRRREIARDASRARWRKK
jgi:hypothetical protein